MEIKKKLDIKLFRENTKQFIIGLFVIFFFLGVYYMSQGGINTALGLLILIFSLIGGIISLVYL